MKERKPLSVKGLYTRDDAGEIVPLTGKYKEEVGAKAKLLITELETGNRYEFADEA